MVSVRNTMMCETQPRPWPSGNCQAREEKRQTNKLWLGRAEAGAAWAGGSGQIDGIQEGFLEEVTPILNLTDK